MEKRPINQSLLRLMGPSILGAVFLVVALGSAAHSCFLLMTGGAQAGRIVALEQQVTVDRIAKDLPQQIVVYVPVFVFQSADGREHRIRAHGGSNPPGFSMGQAVRVVYRSGDPERAVIATFPQLWGPACGFGALGLLLSAIGGVMLMWGWSRRRRGLTTADDAWSKLLARRGITTWF